jgi:hypothetical protein
VSTYFVWLAEWLPHSIEHCVGEAGLEDETVLTLYELQSTERGEDEWRREDRMGEVEREEKKEMREICEGEIEGQLRIVGSEEGEERWAV